MHSSVGVRQSRQEDSSEILTVDLRIVEGAKSAPRSGAFRRIITASEVVADLLTITFSVAAAYTAYRSQSVMFRYRAAIGTCWCDKPELTA